MIFWHLGGALFLFRWIFRDPAADLRFLMLGALLPDLIDMPIGTLLTSYSSGELWFHTLTVASLVLLGAIVFTKRRGHWRKRLVALAIGIFFHLLLDGMWTSTEAFLWPFAGFDFPPGPSPYWGGLWGRASGDPVRWVLGGVGLAYLWWVWFTAGLGDRRIRDRFLKSGQIGEPGR